VEDGEVPEGDFWEAKSSEANMTCGHNDARLDVGSREGKKDRPTDMRE
jgi:hypothetical protein